MHAWNLRQRNLRRIWRRRRRDLCGNARPGGTNDNNPKDRNPDDRAHLGCLYITFAVLSRWWQVVYMLSHSIRRRQRLKIAHAWQLGGRRKNFIAPRKSGSFPKHGRNGAVLVLAELDGVLYRQVVELATKTIEYFQLRPDRMRPCSAFAQANYFQPFEL